MGNFVRLMNRIMLFSTLSLSCILKQKLGARYSSMVRVFVHGAMGHYINPSYSGPIELFRVPASAPRLV